MPALIQKYTDPAQYFKKLERKDALRNERKESIMKKNVEKRTSSRSPLQRIFSCFSKVKPKSNRPKSEIELRNEIL